MPLSLNKTRAIELAPLINRDLSTLAFAERVLAQCELARVPVLERVRYLGIVSGILDEFFEVRVAEQQLRFESLVAQGNSGAGPLATSLQQVRTRVRKIITHQYRLLNAQLLPLLAAREILLVRSEELTAKQRRWVTKTFSREIFPVLTPIAVDPAHPFPTVANKGLHFIVELCLTQGGAASGVVIVKVPRSLPRLIEMNAGEAAHQRAYILLSTLIECEMGRLFPGQQVLSSSQFRVTRDSDLWFDEDESTGLREALASQLLARPFGRAVRLEISAGCPVALEQRLCRQFNLRPNAVYRVDGPVNLQRLSAFADVAASPDTRFPALRADLHAANFSGNHVFATLKRNDVLLHHPYQSFDPVVQFLRSAVSDSRVIAIKQTIYRTGERSVVMDLRLEAIRRGKQVTVVVELTARFDEATNINWADRLEHAGARVVYGTQNLKVHAKLMLILRRERDVVYSYAHIGTGNYSPHTAATYTDFGLITANRDIGRDVQSIFDHLTGAVPLPILRRLWWAPSTMKLNLLAAIGREADNALLGRPALIMARVNALTDEAIITALCRASQAGVRIELIVRGACCLRPNVPGHSENIRVRSIVGRFLEHSRIYYFENGGRARVYLSSADWMSRNLDRRVEVAVPVLDRKLRQRVIDEGFNMGLQDNVQAWQLQKNGVYRRTQPKLDHMPFASQEALIALWRSGRNPS